MADDITSLMTKHKNKMIVLRLRNEQNIKGRLIDFDAHMNLSLANAEDLSAETPVKLGKILLRGDNILALSIPKEQ